MSTTRQRTESWLVSKEPWDSTNSSPFIPYGKSKASASYPEDDEHASLSSHLPLLSRLLRTCASRNLQEIAPYVAMGGIGLGEGTTYKVEKKQVSKLILPKQTERSGQAIEHWVWVAIKRAKFVAPKGVNGEHPLNPKEYSRFKAVMTEVEILFHPPIYQHPNITQLLGYSWDEEASGYAPILVMELAIFGDAKMLFETETLSDAEKKNLCLDVANGLEVVHACMIVHGDLKQENILIFPHPDRRFIAKLSDFELALLDRDIGCYRGTPVYNAPEVHLQQRYQGQAEKTRYKIPLAQLSLCDVFSFGLLVFEILCNGRRYYDLPESKAFQRAVRSDKNEEQEILSLALDFLVKVQLLPLDLMNLCQTIFRCTLHHCPSQRLEGGWSAIKTILGEHCVTESLSKPPLLAITQARHTSPYSILSLCDGTILLDKDLLGPQIWTDLRYLATSGSSAKLRGRASFELFLLYTLSPSAPSIDIHEAVNWLAASALLGYAPAFIVGKRIFQANHLPVPSVLTDESVYGNLHEQLSYLEALPPAEFYSNAVRAFWTEELRNSIPTISIDRPISSPVGFEIWIQQKFDEIGLPEFPALANESLLLHHAVRLQHFEAVKLLLEYGSRTDILTPYSNITPLHMACRCGYKKIIHLLLSYGASASLNDIDNISPLHWLVLLPSHEIPITAHALIKNGANVNSRMNGGALYYDALGLKLDGTPLLWACSCCNLVAAKTLLNCGADPIGCIGQSLSLVNMDMVELFLLHTDTSRTYSSANMESLYCSIGIGSSGTFQRWCIHGADYEESYPQVIDTLNRHNISLSHRPLATLNYDRCYTPLASAVICYNVPLIKNLLQQGANVNDRSYDTGKTALMYAIELSWIRIVNPARICQVVELLLQWGASLEPISDPENDRIGISPLVLACEVGQPDVIRLLLSHARVPINMMHDGFTLLHRLTDAHDSDYEKSICMLLDLGANPDIPSEHRKHNGFFKCCQTVTAKAVMDGNWKVTELLLNRKADTYTGVGHGRIGTLVHACVYRAYWLQSLEYKERGMDVVSFLECLLDHPVVQKEDLINLSNSLELSPLLFAVTLGLPHIVKVLLNRGARTTLCILPSSMSFRLGTNIWDALAFLYQNPPGFVVDCGSVAQSKGNGFGDLQIRFQILSKYKESLDKIRSLLGPKQSERPSIYKAWDDDRDKFELRKDHADFELQIDRWESGRLRLYGLDLARWNGTPYEGTGWCEELERHTKNHVSFVKLRDLSPRRQRFYRKMTNLSST